MAMTDRVQDYARQWNVSVEQRIETTTSFLAFGTRDGLPVVLKVSRTAGEEWKSGEVLAAFGGRGAVRVYEYAGGAALLERLDPATPLAEVVRSGRDSEAVDLLAGVIREMTGAPAGEPHAPSVEDLAVSFPRYLENKDRQVPRDLVVQAHHVYTALCSSQTQRRLLHGDLHHHNVLFDARRGWLAIDPKGVVGELEYEIGAALRNPCECTHLVASSEVAKQRIARFAGALQLNAERVLAWAFSQAVLSALWSIEDGERLSDDHPGLALAAALRPLLP